MLDKNFYFQCMLYETINLEIDILLNQAYNFSDDYDYRIKNNDYHLIWNNADKLIGKLIKTEEKLHKIVENHNC